MNRKGVDIFAPYGFFCGSGTTLRSLKKIRFKDISRQSAADFFELIVNKEKEADL